MIVRSCTGVAPSDVAWILSSKIGLTPLPKIGLVVPAVITRLQEASNAPFTYTTEPPAPVSPSVTTPSDTTMVGAAKTARLAVNTAMKIAVFSICFLILFPFVCATCVNWIPSHDPSFADKDALCPCTSEGLARTWPRIFACRALGVGGNWSFLFFGSSCAPKLNLCHLEAEGVTDRKSTRLNSSHLG